MASINITTTTTTMEDASFALDASIPILFHY